MSLHFLGVICSNIVVEVLRSALLALCAATSHEHLKDEAIPVVKGISRYAALLFCQGVQAAPSQLIEISPLVFVETIAEVPLAIYICTPSASPCRS